MTFDDFVKNIPDKKLVLGFLVLCLCLVMSIVSYYLVYYTESCTTIRLPTGELEKRCFENRATAIEYLKNKTKENNGFVHNASSYNWSLVTSSSSSESIS